MGDSFSALSACIKVITFRAHGLGSTPDFITPTSSILTTI